MSVTMGQVQVPSSVATTCFLIPPGHYNLTVYSNGTNPSVYLSTSSSAATTVSMATTVTPASAEGYQGEGGATLYAYSTAATTVAFNYILSQAQR